ASGRKPHGKASLPCASRPAAARLNLGVRPMEKLLYLAASALLALVPLSTSAEVRSQDVLHDARAWEPDVLVYRKMGVGTFALITARADFEKCGVTKEQAGGVAVLFK